jgi:formylglycine-generating enzyme
MAALANTWITLEVIAVDAQITLKVNGKTTAEHRQSPDEEKSGSIMLYAEAGTGVKFRKVEIKELPTRNTGSEKQQAARTAPPKEITNSIGMKLVAIPPGKFTMGSSATELNRGDDERQHDVEITKPFCLGTREVTQQQFKNVMGYNPSFFSKEGTARPGESYQADSQPAGRKANVPADTSNYPVENVSWHEAVEFCRRLSDWRGEQGRSYRLPTEAEWEYACRGGISGKPYIFGDAIEPLLANFGGRIGTTCEVGSYKPNGFGLYDMHGNVHEWCLDWYDKDYYANSPSKDPQGPAVAGTDRVYRSSCLGCAAEKCRSACRRSKVPGGRHFTIGFRVAFVPMGK